MRFRVLIIGGTGQVGAAVVRALVAEPSCAEVVMVNRRAMSATADRPCAAGGAGYGSGPVSGRSEQARAGHGGARRSRLWGVLCRRRSRQHEVERGGIEGPRNRRGRWLCPRLPGRGHHTVCAALGRGKQREKQHSLCARHGAEGRDGSRTGFQRLAVFRPGIIAGNAHTPRYVAWLGRLIPGRFGTIEQDDIGRAFVAEFVSNPAPDGVVYFENGAMRQRSRALPSRWVSAA